MFSITFFLVFVGTNALVIEQQNEAFRLNALPVDDICSVGLAGTCSEKYPVFCEALNNCARTEQVCQAETQ
jgi:hypothetical protein